MPQDEAEQTELMSQEKAEQTILEALNMLNGVRSASPEYEGKVRERVAEWADNWKLPESMYVPNEQLLSRIADYERWCELKQGEDRGKLMEEIALLAFLCLRGWDSIKSYTSYAQQHDLVISGSGAEWVFLNDYLHLKKSGRTIVVEAKNQEESVSEPQFSRLCYIVDKKFQDTCFLGVFVSRTSATGFSRTKSLMASRATQIVFHAKTGKYVVLLDHEDIKQLKNKGALLKLLEVKIKDVEAAAGLSLDFDDSSWIEVDLPPHLSKYIQ